MNRPSNDNNVPPGLEYIDKLRSVHLKQKIDTLEVLTGWEVKNKWRITDPATGQIIGAFKEDSSCFQRQCCQNVRAFTADIVDAQGDVILKMDRPCHCNCICCTKACDGFCGQEITTLDSTGRAIGKVTQNSDCAILPCCCDWMLTLSDASGHQRWKLGNNICSATCVCCNDRYLYVYDMQMNKKATVTKQWRGCAVECCSHADSILVEFPAEMNAEEKANLIAAVFLSDYNLWERQSGE